MKIVPILPLSLSLSLSISPPCSTATKIPIKTELTPAVSSPSLAYLAANFGAIKLVFISYYTFETTCIFYQYRDWLKSLFLQALTVNNCQYWYTYILWAYTTHIHESEYNLLQLLHRSIQLHAGKLKKKTLTENRAIKLLYSATVYTMDQLAQGSSDLTYIQYEYMVKVLYKKSCIKIFKNLNSCERKSP